MNKNQRAISLWAVVSFLASIIFAQSVVPNPSFRRYPSCGLLSTNGNRRIYCHGGVIKTNQQDYEWDATLMRLDIMDFNATASNTWENITHTAANSNIALEARERAFSAVSFDGSSLFIHGGLSQYKLRNQTIIYTASDNSWSTPAADYTDAGFGGTRQIYQGSAVDVNGKYYLYGGEETFSNQNIIRYTDSYTNETFVNFFLTDSNFNDSAIGYYEAVTYSETIIGYDSWSKLRPLGNFQKGLIGSSHAAVFHPRTTTIFYFGGYVRDLINFNLATTSFSQVTTFNTSNMFWGTQMFTGSAVPIGRMGHTATLLPSNEDVLLYGGASGDIVKAMNDFCYVANLQNFTWTAQFATLKLPNANGATGARAGHSAVLDAITNRLYILFGFYDNSLGPQNTPLIALNVSSPSALAFLDLTQQAMIDPNSSPNVTVLADVKNGINSATIGGAVGGTIGGILVIGLVAFFLHKRKRSNDHNQQNAGQDADEHEERLSVDWDAIEGGFVETNLPLNNSGKNMVPYNGINNINNSNIVLENSHLYSSANEFSQGEKSPAMDYNNTSKYEVSSQTATTVTAVSPPLMNLATPLSPNDTLLRQSYLPDIPRHDNQQPITYITKPDGA
ncbi:Phosphatidylinositol-4-phosphate 5-kinase [Mucor velutinosus]|uniref:Phosphatidylinositol-4-phosphate 5-kinase n=1 Tax=Mucor velutinosus TaxID=708070 RepID=A0AAN7HM24_9FUNG|nr:Phosphatidylinositol-4-phosphate 5-kinase [Mucor velutinosus]